MKNNILHILTFTTLTLMGCSQEPTLATVPPQSHVTYTLVSKTIIQGDYWDQQTQTETITVDILDALCSNTLGGSTEATKIMVQRNPTDSRLYPEGVYWAQYEANGDLVVGSNGISSYPPIIICGIYAISYSDGGI